MRPVLKKIFGYAVIVLGFGLLAGLAFPAFSDPAHAGRSEKRLEVDFSFLEKETSKGVLLYFGYVGCTGVCMPAMQDVSQIYGVSKTHNPAAELSVWFVNMTPQMDAPSVQSWAEHFNREFKSYAPGETELANMVQRLNVVYTPLGAKAEHRPYLYLLQKTSRGYELAYIYTSSPYNRSLILKDIGDLQ